jgi:hypothetical protein
MKGNAIATNCNSIWKFGTLRGVSRDDVTILDVTASASCNAVFQET